MWSRYFSHFTFHGYRQAHPHGVLELEAWNSWRSKLYFELPECKFEKWHDDHLLFEDIRSGLSMTIMEIPTC